LDSLVGYFYVIIICICCDIALADSHTTCVVLQLDVVPLGQQSNSAPFEGVTAIAPGVAHHIVGDAYAVVVDKLNVELLFVKCISRVVKQHTSNRAVLPFLKNQSTVFPIYLYKDSVD